MKIFISKRQFGFEKTNALGHELSGLSMGVNRKKFAAVIEKPALRTVKLLQSFLGFLRYALFRDNVP